MEWHLEQWIIGAKATQWLLYNTIILLRKTIIDYCYNTKVTLATRVFVASLCKTSQTLFCPKHFIIIWYKMDLRNWEGGWPSTNEGLQWELSAVLYCDFATIIILKRNTAWPTFTNWTKYFNLYDLKLFTKVKSKGHVPRNFIQNRISRLRHFHVNFTLYPEVTSIFYPVYAYLITVNWISLPQNSLFLAF